MACGDRGDGVTESGVRLHYLADCAPSRLDGARIEALGDFPIADRSVAQLSLNGGSADTLSRLPADTRWYRLSLEQAQYRGYALFPALNERAAADALVLPLARGCALPAFALQGGRAALAGSALIVASFAERDGSSGSRELARFEPETGETRRSASGLFVPRIAATPLSVGEDAWFIGGAPESSPDTRALDTFERYAAGSVAGLGRLSEGRVSPEAVLLADGSVLVAGGSQRVGQAQLASIELVPPGSSDAVALASALPFPPESLAVRARDDGIVWIAARGKDGLHVYELDVASDELGERSAPLLNDGEALDPALVVALPGARIASFATVAGVSTGTVWLSLPGGETLALADFLPTLAGFAPTASVALRDGRVLLAGTRDGLPEARLLDVGRMALAQHALPFAATSLLARPDGSIVGLAQEGAWILREDTLTPFENLGGTLLADDVEVLALDAAGRFAREGLALIAAVDDARLEIAALTFLDMTISLRASAGAELLLTRPDGKTRSIAIGADSVGPALCELPRSSTGDITVRRHGDQVTLESDGAQRRCTLDGMLGPLRIAMRLRAGARVDELRVMRE